jgi:hypothetical protein
MKNRKNFLIYLSAFAMIVILIIVLLFPGKTLDEEKLPEEVDYTSNILKNSSFENGDLSFWESEFIFDQKSFAFADDIVKFDGYYSLNITSERDSEILTTTQIIKPIQLDKKIIFNGRIRTEDVDAVFLRMKLFSSNDSLILETTSDTLKGTNDWTFLTTWLRTINSNASYLKVECCLQGKGRVWFDKLEVFPVEIKERIFYPSRIR